MSAMTTIANNTMVNFAAVLKEELVIVASAHVERILPARIARSQCLTKNVGLQMGQFATVAECVLIICASVSLATVDQRVSTSRGYLGI